MSKAKIENKFAQRNKPAKEAVSMQAIYLMMGAEAARNSMSKPAPGNSEGHLGQATLMCEFAPLMVEFLENPKVASADMPGVFNYEVTEEMGGWLMFNQEASHDMFVAVLHGVYKKFMAQRPA